MEVHDMKSWVRTMLYFVAAVLITALITATVTITIIRSDDGDVVMLSSEEYSSLNDLMLLDEIIKKIDENAFGESPSREDLVNAAARGMVAELGDRYASYYTAAEYEQYLSSINGEYSGIGILVGQPDENGANVLDVYDDTPASEAGVKAGDIIVAVEGKSVGGMTLEELSNEIARENDEPVKLTLLRASSTFDVTLTAATVNVRRVEHWLFNERTGYIRISMFTGNCVAEFDEALKDLTDRGMRSLVIDLRNNPGGSLADVVKIADAILGECVIVSVRGSNDDEGDVYNSNKKSISVPLAIIVNENSASASEILASAVQDNEAGMVVGMTTFGKGVVQTTMMLESNRGWLKLTTNAYYTPKGSNIHGVGVTPDIEVDLPEDMKGLALDEIEQSDDAQLWAALGYVREAANELD